ncbi:cytochrome b [Gallaecimonas xiamenensis]|uniref:Cytochrome B561 n=1 Tax=Gallaecimonas xiamenensis 3-C-1 TaxID=745411 RepID=K2J0R9_9GAMM|nr:cytochrome b [Gallaecimonas xiamenensis]EKE68412.1 cytochrome B561 [Gallaecimonas xiamenensis 3-C-1]
MWKNSSQGFGRLAIGIHWLSALAVFGLFGLGWWMRTLSYYDPWYRLGPWWHKSIGISLLALTLLRVLWRWRNTKPRPLGTALEQKLAGFGHGLLYLLLVLVMVTGYLISTADGRGISVFDWFEVPALVTGLHDQAEVAGSIHWYAAWSLVVLALGHGLVALKHHFINKDGTLKRMLVTQPSEEN